MQVFWRGRFEKGIFLRIIEVFNDECIGGFFLNNISKLSIRVLL